MASEDRKLVDMAGYANPVAARSRFVAARFVLAILLPIAAVALDLEKNLIDSSVGVLIAAFLGFAVGYMLPKIFVRRRLARRRRQAADELPLLIDLLRLLQGVGLSIDQSLQVLVRNSPRCCRCCPMSCGWPPSCTCADARASNRWRGWRRASTTTISRPSAD